jgi:hypothetical protein
VKRESQKLSTIGRDIQDPELHPKDEDLSSS